MALMSGPKDHLARTKEQIEADDWFAAEVKKCGRGRSSSESGQYKYNSGSQAAQILLKNGAGGNTELTVPLKAGLYDTKKLSAILSKEAIKPGMTGEALAELATAAIITSMLALPQESESAIGSKSSFPAVVGKDVVTVVEMTPLAGTVLDLSKSGLDRYTSLSSLADYASALPFLQSAWANGNTWCVDIPTERVAPMADQTPEMLANLKDQVKHVGGVDVYMIRPVWLRYYSDGDMSSQRTSGPTQLRNAPYARGAGLRPLLYDAPAWCVGLMFGGKILQGRVFVTPEGKFIGSDWCQREADKSGGIDIHTGKYTNHTLMTWCAGPGISRFGGKAAEEFGQVRKANLRKGKVKVSADKGSLIRLAVLAKKFHAEHLAGQTTVDESLLKSSDGEGIKPGSYGLKTVRVSITGDVSNKHNAKLGTMVQFLANIPFTTKGMFYTAVVGIALDSGKPVLKNVHYESMVLPISERGIGIYWQLSAPIVFEISDATLRKEVYGLLKKVIETKKAEGGLS